MMCHGPEDDRRIAAVVGVVGVMPVCGALDAMSGLALESSLLRPISACSGPIALCPPATITTYFMPRVQLRGRFIAGIVSDFLPFLSRGCEFECASSKSWLSFPSLP